MWSLKTVNYSLWVDEWVVSSHLLVPAASRLRPWSLNQGDTKHLPHTRYYLGLLQMLNQERIVWSTSSRAVPAVEMRTLSLLCSLCCSLVHVISGPPAAPVLFALSSPAVELWPVCFNQHSVCQRAYLRRWESLCVLLRCREDKAKWGAGERGHNCMPLIHILSPFFSFKFLSP